MKTIKILIALAIALSFNACSSKYSIDRKSPCACNYDYEIIS